MTDNDSPISVLRSRMLEDMALRKFGAKTQAGYVRAVKNLAKYLKRSPDIANAEDLRAFQLDMVERGVSRTTINAHLSGLRFFFEVTLGRPEVMAKMALLPVPYFHVVFTVPKAIGQLAYQNKAVVYGLLFKVAAQTLLTIGADPKHFGAQLGMTAVLHTWGSAMTQNPHLHRVVPGGGLSLDGTRWVASKAPKFLVSVKVLSRLFRRLMLEHLREAHRQGQLQFFGDQSAWADAEAFDALCRRLRGIKWYVHARAPFAGPSAVLAYLSRYTHRVAIANSRLLAFDAHRVQFRWKDYRAGEDNRYKTMALDTPEFIRRFLIHVLPHRFHRIRHFGLFANGQRRANLIKARALLNVAPPEKPDETLPDETPPPWLTCPACGQGMRVIEIIRPPPRHRGGDPPRV